MTSLTLPSVRPAPHWRWPLVGLAALLLLLLIAYRDTAASMVEIWSRSQTFTHGFLVPPIVLWLAWQKRAHLLPLTPRPAPVWLLPMAAAAFVWYLGHLVNSQAVEQFFMTTLLVLAVPLTLGWPVTRVLLFPLAFLFFAVPIGEFLEPTLMKWTAEALVGGLRLSGIPVHQEGQQLVIPSGRWEVVAACSGIRYLMATLMAGSLFAYLNYRSARKRLVFALVSMAVPVLANWMRAYIIVMLGHLSNNKIATGVDHLVYGWVFFGAVILLLFYVGARYADDEPPPPEAGAAQAALARPATASLGLWLCLLAGLGAALWPLGLVRSAASHGPAAPVELSLPERLGRWEGAAPPFDSWHPSHPGAARQEARLYRSPAGEVLVNLSYYRQQGGARGKLVSASNTLTPAGDRRWNVLSRGREAVAMPGGGTQQWLSARILGAEEAFSVVGRPRLTVWRIYWVGGPLVDQDVPAKLTEAWQALRGQPDDGAAVYLAVDHADEQAARETLKVFVGENFGMLTEELARAKRRQ